MAGSMRVLTWNLMHGRAVPPAGRDLLGEFAAALAGWEWDVSLLQEVPPWWPASLGRRLGADQRLVLTSRNSLLRLRREIAVRRPDLIKSNGGGCNAILVRGERILEHRARRLCLLPERRWVHAVRVPWGGGAWLGNVHAAAQAAQGRLAGRTLLEWAAGAPVVLGGDFNVRSLSLDGFDIVASHGVDHVFAGERLYAVERSAKVLERGSLSDHVPISVSVMESAGYIGKIQRAS